ncbi:MAG: DNA-binding protein [Geobacter sp.]|nr:MAG: DNA-binding protein [Geobacter sp.]
MSYRRFTLTLILSIFLSGLAGNASAGFLGFGSEEKGKTGLDFNRGYDLNTVGIVNGHVMSLPHAVENEQYAFEIQTGTGPVNVTVGPGSYWQKSGIALRINDEISAKGAKAQGQDGKQYLLTQKLVNRTTGTTAELRSENGAPVWSGKNSGSSGFRSQDGRFGGGFMRGGGMMGGGGMMRR